MCYDWCMTDDEIAETVGGMVTDIMKYLKDVRNRTDDTTVNKFWCAYLGVFLTTGIYGSLNAGAKQGATLEEQHENARDMFARMRATIETVVADSATSAIKAFSGQEIEYFCQLRPVGDPLNKVMC